MNKLEERKEALIDWIAENFGDPEAFWSPADELIPIVRERYEELEKAMYDWDWLPSNYTEWGYEEMKNFLDLLDPLSVEALDLIEYIKLKKGGDRHETCTD